MTDLESKRLQDLVTGQYQQIGYAVILRFKLVSQCLWQRSAKGRLGLTHNPSVELQYGMADLQYR